MPALFIVSQSGNLRLNNNNVYIIAGKCFKKITEVVFFRITRENTWYVTCFVFWLFMLIISSNPKTVFYVNTNLSLQDAHVVMQVPDKMASGGYTYMVTTICHNDIVYTTKPSSHYESCFNINRQQKSFSLFPFPIS